jgi:hypothetical protein
MENDDTKKMLLGIVHTSGKKTYLLSVLERHGAANLNSFFVTRHKSEKLWKRQEAAFSRY